MTSAPSRATVERQQCPPGLEYLQLIDQMLVHQQIQFIELLVGYEQANKYVVKNTMGQFIFFGVEESDCIVRCLCGQNRPFELRLLDHTSREVIRLFRPLRCSSGLCFCCLQDMSVQAPPGNVVGYVKQNCSIIYPYFSILDANRKLVLLVKGPFITSSCFGDVVFNIFTPDEKHKVGVITKNWTGIFKEMLTDVDNFTVVFPIDLDVKFKAVLLGCTFLIETREKEVMSTTQQMQIGC
ncbi:hypothetical protein HPB47_010158 [Ixodes persulcatus]|uniref:Uncharacterized protein n=1 Tax=Ixodes persulcatus TaxID=34615 RepID=A0AC60P088_IXOPE|nr:hypothetical protein HPB47_010158 [Ixodes persulcatus]